MKRQTYQILFELASKDDHTLSQFEFDKPQNIVDSTDQVGNHWSPRQTFVKCLCMARKRVDSLCLTTSLENNLPMKKKFSK